MKPLRKSNFGEKVTWSDDCQTQCPPELPDSQTSLEKERNPCVMGVCMPSMLPQEAFKHVDAVVVRKAEAVWPDLIKDRRGQMKRGFM